MPFLRHTGEEAWPPALGSCWNRIIHETSNSAWTLRRRGEEKEGREKGERGGRKERWEGERRDGREKGERGGRKERGEGEGGGGGGGSEGGESMVHLDLYGHILI